MRVKNRGEIVIWEILEALKNGGVSFRKHTTYERGM